MKLSKNLAFLPLLLLLFSSPALSSEAETFKVLEVIDGDTIKIDYHGHKESVRYIGINTPETKHPSKPVEYYGKEASDYNKKLVEGKKVRLEFDIQRLDRYKRLLAYVYVGDIFVNAELVKQGYAQVATYPPNAKYQELFLKLQREAIENNRGLWAKKPEKETKTESYYIGNKRSKVFHKPDCIWAKKIKPKNLIKFKNKDEAYNKGFRPGKCCNP